MKRLAGVLCAFAAPAAMAQPAAVDAAALYQQYCAQCHGATMQGGNAQSLVDGVWNHGEGRGYVSRNTKHGITEYGMPAYEATLSDNEINAIVDYILTAEKTAGAVRPPIPEATQTQEYEVKIEKWVEGLELPWAIAFPDAETALITERSGKLLVVKNGALQAEPVSGTPEVLAESQGGLMEVAIDPNYADNGYVYLSFSHGIPAKEGDRVLAMTKIVRGRIKDNAWTDEETVYEAPHETYLPTRQHYGCRIVFDKEGYLYFSIGERGVQDHAQELGRPNGKVHRIWPDGRIPEDNPFVKTPGALPTIYSYGNRNPQGMAVSPVDGLLWASEHGPMGGDELNVIASGANYGWPVVTYGRNYNGQIVSDKTHAEGIAQPSLFWRPSIAVSGVDFYTGDAFGRWKNALLVAALRYEEVRLLRIEGDRVLHQETILKNVGRVRSVNTGPDGAIYVVTNSPNAVLRLTPIGERSY